MKKLKVIKIKVYRGKKYLKTIMRTPIVQGCGCGTGNCIFCRYHKKKYEIHRGMIKV